MATNAAHPADLADTARISLESDRYRKLLKLRALRHELARIERDIAGVEAELLGTAGEGSAPQADGAPGR